MYQIKSHNADGQGLIEYALLIALVSSVVILSLSVMGIGVKDIYCGIVENLGGSDVCRSAFAEDFSDISDWVSSWGKWDNSNDELCGSRWGGIFNEDFSGDDYTVNVGKANLAQGKGYGVYFRTQDYKKPNGYIFQYDPGWGGGAFLFRKWVNGHELSPFAVQRAPGFDWHGEDHNIQLVVEGDTFKAYVDGQEMLSASDSTYSEGGVGFRVWDRTKVCFDDLSITTP